MVFASSLISVLTSSHITKEDANLMLLTETFISVLLDLVKATIMDSEVLMQQDRIFQFISTLKCL
jgi:hypothetical protein